MRASETAGPKDMPEGEAYNRLAQMPRKRASAVPESASGASLSSAPWRGQPLVDPVVLAVVSTSTPSSRLWWITGLLDRYIHVCIDRWLSRYLAERCDHDAPRARFDNGEQGGVLYRECLAGSGV
jgi:hypothetical protein